MTNSLDISGSSTIYFDVASNLDKITSPEVDYVKQISSKETILTKDFSKNRRRLNSTDNKYVLSFENEI